MIIDLRNNASIESLDGHTWILRDRAGTQVGFHDRPRGAFDDALARGIITGQQMPALGMISEWVNSAAAALGAAKRGTVELFENYRIDGTDPATWAVLWHPPGKGRAEVIGRHGGLAAALDAAVWHRLCRGPGLTPAELVPKALASLVAIMTGVPNQTAIGAAHITPASPDSSPVQRRSWFGLGRKTGKPAKGLGLGIGLGGGIGKGRRGGSDLRL